MKGKERSKGWYAFSPIASIGSRLLPQDEAIALILTEYTFKVQSSYSIKILTHIVCVSASSKGYTPKKIGTKVGRPRPSQPPHFR
jgi:hypothetical protein